MNNQVLNKRNEDSLKIVQKRKEIILAALTVFSQEGLSGARMDKIASAANMSKSNLFYYFDSKDQLYIEVLQDVLTKWLLPLSKIDSQQDPQEALTTYIEAKYQLSKSLPEASKLYALEIIQGAPHLMSILKGPLRGMVKEKVMVIEGWIADEKIKPISAIHLIFHIWAVTQHYADFSTQIEAVSNKSLSNKKFAKEAKETTIQLLVEGIMI